MLNLPQRMAPPLPEGLKQNLIELVQNLQVLRDFVGVPIKINSGYRSPEHNRKVGGAKKSLHLRAMAADIVVANHTPQQVRAIIEKLIKEGKMKQGGIGLYNTFVHYDIRGERKRW